MTMVDVSGKAEIFREATAKGTIKLKPETVKLIREGENRQGRPALHGENRGNPCRQKNKRIDSSLSSAAVDECGSGSQSLGQYYC